MSKPKIVLTLESVPSKVPLVNRLRCVLKRLLRTYGFRCVKIDGDILGEPDSATAPKKETP